MMNEKGNRYICKVWFVLYKECIEFNFAGNHRVPHNSLIVAIEHATGQSP